MYKNMTCRQSRFYTLEMTGFSLFFINFKLFCINDVDTSSQQRRAPSGTRVRFIKPAMCNISEAMW